MFASSESGTALLANCISGLGLSAGSTSNSAIAGVSKSVSLPAVIGRSRGENTGVLGWSGNEAAPASPARTGVYGSAIDHVDARGVTGEAQQGRGVQGIATSGVGGHFSAGAAGKALQAVGRVAFSTSGLATVTEGTSSIVVTPGIDLVASSRILCTLETGQIGLSIERVLKNAAADTFTVFLTALVATGNTPRVAWFVIG